MDLKSALEQLKIYSKELENKNDIKEFITNNNQEFLKIESKIKEYYKYITKNGGMTDIWFEAVNILSDISFKQPNLEEWVEKVINETTKEQKFVDDVSLANKIDSYITEIKEMYNYDTDQAENIEFQLQKCREELISNKNVIDDNKYNYMMSQITIALEEIERRREILSSIHL